MLIAHLKRYLIGDIIGNVEFYTTLIICPDLTQFIAQVCRLVSLQIVCHNPIREIYPQPVQWSGQEYDLRPVSAEIEGAAVRVGA